MRARRCWPLAVVLALGACDGEGPAAPPLAPGTESVKGTRLAQLDLGEGRRFSILATSSGDFIYTQSGPYSARPVEVPANLWDKGPAAVHRHLAPGKPVPKEVLEASSGILDPGGAEVRQTDAPPIQAAGDSVGGIRQAALGSTDGTSSGSTGSSGCPWEFFTAASPGGTPLCPSGGASYCARSMQWATYESGNAADSYGTMCVDKYVGQLNWVVGGEVAFSAAEFPGTWRMIQHAARNSCSWSWWPPGWSCTPSRVYQKYELVNIPGGVSHFGAHFD